jgi:6,7-dimethyl-8-ribityllumazine synthase
MHSTNSASLTQSEIKNVPNYHFAIIVSEWNKNITDKLRDGALNILAQLEVPIEHIITLQVPGSFELPLAAKWAIEHLKADAVLCLGCVIKGETKHDEYISNAVSQSISNLNIQTGVPVIFGVLTVDSILQAEERAGGKHGNKGAEAALTAIKMLNLKNELTQ